MTTTATRHRKPGEYAQAKSEREQRHRERVELAGHALEGMLACPDRQVSYDKTPASALTFADRLLEEIDRTEGKGI